jgi:hypothetical protein
MLLDKAFCVCSQVLMQIRIACRQGRSMGFKHEGSTMKLLTDLFTTDYGLMSAAGIAFMLCMAVWFRMFFKRKMDEDAKNAGA